MTGNHHATLHGTGRVSGSPEADLYPLNKPSAAQACYFLSRVSSCVCSSSLLDVLGRLIRHLLLVGFRRYAITHTGGYPVGPLFLSLQRMTALRETTHGLFG